MNSVNMTFGSRSAAATNREESESFLKRKRQQKREWNKTYYERKRMRLLKEAREKGEDSIVKFIHRPSPVNEPQREDERGHGVKASSPARCSSFSAGVIRPVETVAELRITGNVSTGRKLTEDDVNVDVRADRLKANQHKTTQSCANDLSTLNGSFPEPPRIVRTVLVPNARSTSRTATNNQRCLEDKVDRLVETTEQITSMLQSSMQTFMEQITSTLQHLQTLVAEIRTQRVGLPAEMRTQTVDHSLNTSSATNISVRSATSNTVLPRSGHEAVITAKQRSILCRTPAIVSTDSQQNELEDELGLSGRGGAFFKVLVKTLRERLTNTTDTNKTALSCLRTVYDEHYLAERVTMAGYKKVHCNERYYGDPENHFVALSDTVLYWAIFETVKLACRSSTSDEKVKKAIRDAVNTLRVQDKDRRMRQAKRLGHCSNEDIGRRRDIFNDNDAGDDDDDSDYST